MEIGQLVLKIQAVEGLQKQKETKKHILKSVFASSDSFCLITSHIKSVKNNVNIFPVFSSFNSGFFGNIVILFFSNFRNNLQRKQTKVTP